jgi:hypothetical protein
MTSKDPVLPWKSHDRYNGINRMIVVDRRKDCDGKTKYIEGDRHGKEES